MVPIVSIIVATKNAETYLRESLESIGSQSFENYEIILVDANSTDKTLQIAAEYPKVRSIQQNGVGFADAWNCGIADARGKYIAFLDSDDRWSSDKLELQVNLLEGKQDAEIVIGRVQFFHENTESLPETFRASLLLGSHVAHMPGAMLVRREVFERIGMFDSDMRIASDIDWFAKLKDAGIQESLIDQVLIEKRVHQKNLSYTGARDSSYDRELLLTLRRSILRRQELNAQVALNPQSREWPAIDLISRSQFVENLSTSVSDGLPYATGKLGVSEKRWIYYPLFLQDHLNPRKRAAYAASLRFHSSVQSGIFPVAPAFLQRFSNFYLEHLKNIDCIGLFGHDIERELVSRLDLKLSFTNYLNQEPDRSIPADESNCYLPALENKRVLILSPFAELLSTNATRDRFEAIWKKTGKPWFNPAQVLAMEFPSALSAKTQSEYPSIIDLYDEICQRISEIDFDVALIGAGSLNIPIASYVKKLGKVGIALGGHLQVVFGVLGKRWLERPDWKELYINDQWIKMEEKYRPDSKYLTDDGAYW